MSLDAVRIVLVQPSHPGNIGAAARAMKTMGVSRLGLVGPADPTSEAARARAAGADDVLEAAFVAESLDAAVADCRFVIGTSARSRRVEWPALEPHAAAHELLAESARGPVALVFGRERTGLTNEELDRCQFVVSIPSAPEFPSLNLAAAVQVMSYELRRAALAGAVVPQRPAAAPPATHEGLRRFYEHAEALLIEADFLDARYPRKLMRRLIRVFQRARLDESELAILRGILTELQRKLRRNT